MDDETSIQPLPISIEHQRQILDAVCHDLRSSGRQVKSFGQILAAQLGDGVDPEIASNLRTIDGAADRLIQQLDAITRLASVSVAPQIGPVSLLKAVGQALSKHPETPKTVNQVASNVTVLADHELLLRLLGELIGNSVKFATDPTSIAVTSNVEADRCVVRVTDAGPGIAASSPEVPFNLFRRFHDRSVPGTGTGLTVARTIAEQHGSSIDFVSSPELGTSVSFTLPIAVH